MKIPRFIKEFANWVCDEIEGDENIDYFEMEAKFQEVKRILHCYEMGIIHVREAMRALNEV